MTLVDTGPLVALFDPHDADHPGTRATLRKERRLCTTVPVLTEAFHLLSPSSRGAAALREFVLRGGLAVWSMDPDDLARAFELMDLYADQEMDLADASLVVAAERLETRRVLTLDRRDFDVYRVRRGHRRLPFKVIRPRQPRRG